MHQPRARKPQDHGQDGGNGGADTAAGLHQIKTEKNENCGGGPCCQKKRTPVNHMVSQNDRDFLHDYFSTSGSAVAK